MVPSSREKLGRDYRNWWEIGSEYLYILEIRKRHKKGNKFRTWHVFFSYETIATRYKINTWLQVKHTYLA